MKRAGKGLVLIVSLAVLLGICVYLLVSSVMYLTNILISSTPIDSIGSAELATSLIIAFSVLTVAFLVGIIFAWKKYKSS